MWPGGVRNRLYDVHQGEQIIFPEIPCSYDGNWVSKQVYKTCVEDALNELVASGILTNNQKGNFLSSALNAFDEQ